MKKKKNINATAPPGPKTIPRDKTGPDNFRKQRFYKDSVLRKQYRQSEENFLDFVVNNSPIAKKFSQEARDEFMRGYPLEDEFMKTLFDSTEVLRENIMNTMNSPRADPRLKELLSKTMKVMNSPYRKVNGTYEYDISFRTDVCEKTAKKIIEIVEPDAREMSVEEKMIEEMETMTDVLADIAPEYATQVLMLIKNRGKSDALRSYLTIASMANEEALMDIIRPQINKKNKTFLMRVGGYTEENLQESNDYLEKLSRMLLKKILMMNFKEKKIIGQDEDEEGEDTSVSFSPFNYFIWLLMMVAFYFGNGLSDLYTVNPYSRANVVQNSTKLNAIEKEFGFNFPKDSSDNPYGEAFNFAMLYYDNCMFPFSKKGDPRNVTITPEEKLYECLVIADDLIYQTKGVRFLDADKEDPEFIKKNLDYDVTTPPPDVLIPGDQVKYLNFYANISQKSISDMQEMEQYAAQSHVCVPYDLFEIIEPTEDLTESNKFSVDVYGKFKNVFDFVKEKSFQGTLWFSRYKAVRNVPSLLSGLQRYLETGYGTGVNKWVLAWYILEFSLEAGSNFFPDLTTEEIRVLEQEREKAVNVKEFLKEFSPLIDDRSNYGLLRTGNDTYTYTFLNQQVETETRELLNELLKNPDDAFSQYVEGFNRLSRIFQKLLVRYILSTRGEGLENRSFLEEQSLNYHLQNSLNANGLNSRVHPQRELVSRLSFCEFYNTNVCHSIMDTLEKGISFVSFPITSKLELFTHQIYQTFAQVLNQSSIDSSYVLDFQSNLSEKLALMNGAIQEFFALLLIISSLGLIDNGLDVLVKKVFGNYTFVEKMRKRVMFPARISINSYIRIWSIALGLNAYSSCLLSVTSLITFLTNYSYFTNGNMFLQGIGALSTVFFSVGGSSLLVKGITKVTATLLSSISNLTYSSNLGPSTLVNNIRDVLYRTIWSVTPLPYAKTLIMGKSLEVGVLRNLSKFVEEEYKNVLQDRKIQQEDMKSIELLNRIKDYLLNIGGSTERMSVTEAYVNRLYDPELNGFISVESEILSEFRKRIMIITMMACAESSVLPSDMASLAEKNINEGPSVTNWMSRVNYRGKPFDEIVLASLSVTDQRNNLDLSVSPLRNIWENTAAVDVLGWLSWESTSKKKVALATLAAGVLLGLYLTELPKSKALDPTLSFITNFENYMFTNQKEKIASNQPILSEVSKAQNTLAQFYQSFFSGVNFFDTGVYSTNPWDMQPYIRSATVYLPTERMNQDLLLENVQNAISPKSFDDVEFLIKWGQRLKIQEKYYYGIGDLMIGIDQKTFLKTRKTKYNTFIERIFSNPKLQMAKERHFSNFSFDNSRKDVQEFKKLLFELDEKTVSESEELYLISKLSEASLRQRVALKETIEYKEKGGKLIAIDDRFYFDESLIRIFNEDFSEDRKIPESFFSDKIEEKDAYYRTQKFTAEEFKKVLVIYTSRTKNF